MAITIIGLGPGDPELLTRKAWRILETATEVHLRTARHPGVEALPKSATWHSFDDWYDRAANFETLYREIAAEVVRLGARPEGVIYAVPGHPLVGETTITHILTLARAQQIKVEIVDGLSFIEPTLAALGFDAMNGVQIQDAMDVAKLHHPPINPDQPAILGQLYSLAVASDVKLTLMNQYPEDHPVTLVHGAGTPDQQLETLPLYEIDRSERVSHLTSLYVPPLPNAGSFERFQETIAHLRAPEGCPWDQKQTHLSLRQYLLEETYEVLAALDAEDPDALREELGDLLLQIVLHSQIAVDDGEFRMADVIETVNTKMIQRHPHVWGAVQVEGAEQVLVNWEALKQKEKAEKAEQAAANGTPDPSKSMLASIPLALPALSLAEKYSSRAARVGFDWPDIPSVLAKVHEEINEVQQAATPEDRAAEIGDVLFSVVNWARKLDIDAETALRETCAKWARRFQYLEQQANYELSALTLDQMDALWNEAKQRESP
jgi:tetrapyrrole methylase family protein / MazG family protein